MVFCHMIFPMESTLIIQISQSPTLSVLSPETPDSDDPPKTYPPSLVKRTLQASWAFPPIVFCHKILPSESSLTIQQSVSPKQFSVLSPEMLEEDIPPRM